MKKRRYLRCDIEYNENKAVVDVEPILTARPSADVNLELVDSSLKLTVKEVQKRKIDKEEKDVLETGVLHINLWKIDIDNITLEGTTLTILKDNEDVLILDVVMYILDQLRFYENALTMIDEKVIK